MEKKSYLYQHYTWPELGEASKRQPVVVLPVGSVEDHGRHLPLDTDNFLIWSICESAAQRAAGDILLMPLVSYGFETHHMDFPGTIDIESEHLLHFVLDITKSVAHHGFKRILLADGHGSNMPVLDIVARRTNLETESLCGAFIWPSLVAKEVAGIRESGRGGMAHACELETSVYLYLDQQRVQMSEAKKEVGMPASEFIWMDILEGSPVLLMDRWSRFSESAVSGDPTLASAEKGKVVFQAAVEALVRLAREFKNRPRGERRDFHPQT
ncbi:MAG: creatininase family protein [Terriglobia bacterium]